MYHSKNLKNRIKSKVKLFILCFALVVAASTAFGDVEQGQATAGVKENISAGDVNISSGEAITAGGTIQTITFDKDSKVKDGLRVLSAMYKKNIVPTSKIDGVMGFTRLYNVTFEEAMDAILGVNFKYEQEGQLIKVYTTDEYKKIKEDTERMTYKVFTLYYITAEEAKKLLKPVLSTVAKIESSSPAEKSISSISGSGGGSGGSLGSGGGGDSMALHDTIVVCDYPENIAKAEKVIAAVDVRPKQILIEATILSATLTEETKLGIDWNLLKGDSLIGTSATSDLISGDSISRGTSATTPIEQIAQGVTGTAMETAGFAVTGLSGLRIGVTSGNLAAFITALETITDVTILANPKILAVNKQEGMLHVGKTLGYRGSTTISTGGVATQGEDKFLDSGTKLVFRPYIGGDGYIRMDIHPEDSTAQLNIDKVPDKTTAEVKTNILVKDGETIIIGGLFRDVVTAGRSQIPILGDIPLAGALFRGTNDKVERQEVMVLLTPHIIEEPNEVESQARTADVSRKRSAAKDELQWTDRARLTEDSYTEAVKYYLAGNKEAALNKLNWALLLRPTYMEALRLKERIIRETTPDDKATIERIMRDVIEREESGKWMRR